MITEMITELITEVKKLKNNEYLMNDSVIMSNLAVTDGEASFDVSYDPEMVTEKEAIQLCEEFLTKAAENGAK